jgi:PAS domain S-box-containing protein
MKNRLVQQLTAREAEILERWVARVRSSSLRSAQRPPEEIAKHQGAALLAVRKLLDGQDSRALIPFAAALAEQRLNGDFDQAEAVQAMLFGREVVLDTVRDELSPLEFVEATHRVDKAFGTLVTSFARSFCALCMGRQDEKREEVERHLEIVIERSQDAMVLFDEDRVVRSWNRGAERIFGYPAEQVLGRSLDLIVPADRLKSGEIAGLMRELREFGHARISETQRRRADGTLVWVDASFTAVSGSQGRGLGIWAIFRDISRRKRLEDEKLQAERLALIGTMSAKLAHEVRNPLNSLVLGLDLIRDNLGELEAVGGERVRETQQLLGSIESEMERIQKVVEHYLRFAHLPQLQLKQIDLDEALRWRLDLIRPDLELRHIRLEVRLGAGGAQVMADEDQLWQAILNLVRNAIEAMPQGGTLRVSTAARGDSVQCELADTGVGMTADVLAKMFRPFFSTKGNGTGLGMPLSQQIVQEHGGTIDCESAPGMGTRFLLALPPAGPGGRAGVRAATAARRGAA